MGAQKPPTESPQQVSRGTRAKFSPPNCGTDRHQHPSKSALGNAESMLLDTLFE
jgi:hypothetical protein